MKPAQWSAVLILVLMVGGITFVMVYLGSSRAPSAATPTPQSASLTFAQKRYPEEGDTPLVTEVNRDGHKDFWFVNDSGRDVPVGLIRKGCTCTTVELSLAPESWKERLTSQTSGRVLRSALAPGGLEMVRALAALYAPALPESEAKTTPVTLEDSVLVPKNTFGWVRLRWKRDNAQTLNTDADLWVGRADGVSGVHLEVSVLIVPAMKVNSVVSAGAFNIRDLEEGQKRWILCWSMTRPSFGLKRERVHDRLAAKSDAVDVGQPIPLTADDLRHVAQSEKTPLPPLSGYRIPVMLHAEGKDHTPIEWGHFRRYVKLTSDDKGIDPVEVRVTGTVQGEVTVGGGKERGVINLGPFSRGRGARGDILLQTDVKKLGLELDTSRLPEFLQARLGEPETSPSGHRVWILEVEVLPGKASGEFPRGDDPRYRDSAIYVQTKEDKPRSTRSIRIPVMGAANAN